MTSTDANSQLPRDARIVSVLLKSMGLHEVDPRVIPQLLEFAHRYTVDVFQDALVYSEHAGKNEIDLEDVRLAIQGRVNHSFTSPPSKEFIIELARERNHLPLPPIPEKYGIRLPPERHCLTAVNFNIVPEKTSNVGSTTLNPRHPQSSLPQVLQQPNPSFNVQSGLSRRVIANTTYPHPKSLPTVKSEEGGRDTLMTGMPNEEPTGSGDEDEDEEMEEVDPLIKSEAHKDSDGIDSETNAEIVRKRRAVNEDYDF